MLRVISATGMDIGRDALSPVTDDYDGPFPFTGKIHRVVFDVPKRIPKKAFILATGYNNPPFVASYDSSGKHRWSKTFWAAHRQPLRRA